MATGIQSALELAMNVHGPEMVQMALLMIAEGTLRIDSTAQGRFLKCSVLRSDAEVTARMRAIQPVLAANVNAAQVGGIPKVNGNQKAGRNIAEHNFGVEFATLPRSQYQQVQRNGRKAKDCKEKAAQQVKEFSRELHDDALKMHSMQQNGPTPDVDPLFVNDPWKEAKKKKLKKEVSLDLEQKEVSHELHDVEANDEKNKAIKALTAPEPKNDKDVSNQNPKEFFELLAHVHAIDPGLAGIILDAKLASKSKDDT